MKRPTTPLSGSGGTTTPGCTSTSAPRSATNSEKRWRHDVALPITVVVIRYVVYLVTPNVVSFCASSTLTATSSSRGAISTGVNEPERERDIVSRVVA